MSNYALVLLLLALLVYSSIGFMQLVPAVEAETVQAGGDPQVEPAWAFVPIETEDRGPRFLP